MDGVFVKFAKVAGTVYVDEQVEHLALCVRASIGTGLFEVFHNAADGSAVEATHAPYAFGELAIVVAFES